MGNSMNSYRKRFVSNQDVQSIVSAARAYDKNLNKRSFLIAYGKGSSSGFLEISFSADKFRHLIGVQKDRFSPSAEEFYKSAVNGVLTKNDLKNRLSIYFRPKIIAAKYLNEFPNVISHVSKVDHAISHIKGSVWISSDSVNLAIGAFRLEMDKSSSIGYVPTSLQLMNHRDIEEKSKDGIVNPIFAVFSRKTDDMEYTNINYLDEELTDAQETAVSIAMNSYCNTKKLRETYPAIVNKILAPESSHESEEIEDLDDLMASYSFEDELKDVNSRRYEIEDEISK